LKTIVIQSFPYAECHHAECCGAVTIIGISFFFPIVFNEKFLAMSVTFKSHFMTRSAFAQTKKTIFGFCWMF
jgi:hypothetical protein